MIAQGGNGVTSLAMELFFPSGAQPLFNLAQADQFRYHPFDFGDLSPPRQRGSLLSLHCALTL